MARDSIVDRVAVTVLLQLRRGAASGTWRGLTSGLTLDLRGLFNSPWALLRVPMFLLALLAVRGLPALLYLPSMGRQAAAAAALLQATSLPFIVAATQIGIAIELMTSVTAAALICAGLLSVVFFPIGALSLMRPSTTTSTSAPVT
jgi:hypothetical protein